MRKIKRRCGVRLLLGKFQRDSPIEFKIAVKYANPNYAISEDYKRNCQRCVITFEMRLGYIVEAMPNPWHHRSGTRLRRNFNGTPCFQNASMEKLVMESPEATKDELMRRFACTPIGSRWAIYWLATRRKLKTSHIIAGENIDGQLVFAYPQIGEYGDHVLPLADPDFGYHWFRMDNLALVEDFEWEEIITAARL